MKKHPYSLLLLLGLTFLQACAGASVPVAHPVVLASLAEEGEQEPVALGPRFRLPRIKKPPPSSAQAAPQAAPPAANGPAAQQSSPPASPSLPGTPPAKGQQQSPGSTNPLARGFLNPTIARNLFGQRMAEAQKRFPHLYGGPTQKHHAHPVYLGGPQNGPTVDLDPAYHQLITNTFREEYKYGQAVPSVAEQQRIMRRVYSRYPLPGIHF